MKSSHSHNVHNNEQRQTNKNQLNGEIEWNVWRESNLFEVEVLLIERIDDTHVHRTHPHPHTHTHENLITQNAAYEQKHDVLHKAIYINIL